MATEIDLTNGVIRTTSSVNTVQNLSQAVDVSRHDQLDLLLHVVGIVGSASTFTVSIISGMTLETEDGWPTLASFSSVTTVNGVATLNVPRLFRYVRWKVTALEGATSVSFTVRGMARLN